MHLASEGSDAEIAQKQATRELSWALRDLTANLLRVVRGAGKAYMIPEQTQALLLALVGYQNAVGTLPPDHELSELLAVGQDRVNLSTLAAAEASRTIALDLIVRGSLQVAASRLVGQGTQWAAGENEMYLGITEIERLRSEVRTTMERAPRRTPVAAPSRGGKPKKAPKA